MKVIKFGFSSKLVLIQLISEDVVDCAVDVHNVMLSFFRFQ